MSESAFQQDAFQQDAFQALSPITGDIAAIGALSLAVLAGDFVAVINGTIDAVSDPSSVSIEASVTAQQVQSPQVYVGGIWRSSIPYHAEQSGIRNRYPISGEMKAVSSQSAAAIEARVDAFRDEELEMMITMMAIMEIEKDSLF